MSEKHQGRKSTWTYFYTKIFNFSNNFTESLTIQLKSVHIVTFTFYRSIYRTTKIQYQYVKLPSKLPKKPGVCTRSFKLRQMRSEMHMRPRRDETQRGHFETVSRPRRQVRDHERSCAKMVHPRTVTHLSTNLFQRIDLALCCR